MAILNDDINQLERFLDEGINDILQLITTIIVVGGVFMAIAPSMAWMAICPCPSSSGVPSTSSRLLAPRYAAVREQVGMLNSQLSNNLGGIATIKSFTAEAHETGADRPRESNATASATGTPSAELGLRPVIRMVIVMGFIAILYFGGIMALNGSWRWAPIAC